MNYKTTRAYELDEQTSTYIKTYPITHQDAIYVTDAEDKTLGTKLTEMQNETISTSNKIGDLIGLPTTDKTSIVNSIKEINADLSEKANQTDLDSTNTKVTTNTSDISTLKSSVNSLASGSPKGVYSTLSALQTAYPTGNSNIYIVNGDIKEVETLTVTAIPTTAGNITITLDGVAFTVALTTAMTTTDLVGTAIRGTAFSGWTTGGSGSVVTFTKTTSGLNTTPVFSAGSTGSTATITVTTVGVASDYGWYYWNGSAWTRGNTYQSTGIADKSISFYNFDDFVRNSFYYRQIINPTFLKSGGLMANGTIGTYGSSWKLTDYITLDNWTHIDYKLSCYKNGSTILAGLAFYDINYTFISSITPDNADISTRNDIYGTYTYVVSGVVEIPANAMYVRFGNANVTTNGIAYTDYSVKFVYDAPSQDGIIINSDKIKHNDYTLKNFIDNATIGRDLLAIPFTTNGLLADGTLLTNTSWSHTDFYYVSDYSKIEYDVTTYKNGSTILAGLAFYDINYTFISSITPDNADYTEVYYGGASTPNGDYVVKGIIDIPATCKYIRVGKRTGVDKNVYPSTITMIRLSDSNEHLINSNNIYKDGIKPINDIFDEINNLSLNPMNNNIIADKYIDLSGNIVEYATHDVWSYCDTYFTIDCVDSISMRMREGVSSIAYYDIDYNFLSCEYATDTVNHYNDINSFVNKPLGAVFFRLTWFNSYESYLNVKFKNINLYNNKLIDIARNNFPSTSPSFLETEWKGKKCGFIGDSITYGVGTTKPYHSYLADLLGITSYSYGVNGATISSMYTQATTLYTEHPDIDCIFIFGGTNDYNANVPLGSFYTETDEAVNVNGVDVTRKYKNISTDDTSTFANRLNKLINYVKTNFPNAQIILMTPLHRGYATFSSNNVQPSELYANALNLYIEDYVDCVLKAGEFWSCPVINLFKDSGLYPTNASYSNYFSNVSTDLLHPNAKGHGRIAKTIMGKLNSIPCDVVV